MSFRSAKVYRSGDYCGTIRQLETGYEFVYDEGYRNRPDALPVSLTLPLNMPKIHSKTMIPFFDGLIPEGWLLDVAVETWKLSSRDRFGLLLALCKDCIGDISIQQEESDE